MNGDIAADGWYADPYGRAVRRYWNGVSWTPYVVDGSGQQGVDDPSSAGRDNGMPTATAHGHAIVIQNIVHSPAPLLTSGYAGISQAKSTTTAGWLAFLFGPLGMIYSTGKGAIVMLLVNLVVIPLTLGFGLLITIPIGVVWAVNAAKEHNARLYALTTPATAPQPVRPASPGVGYVAHPQPGRPMSLSAPPPPPTSRPPLPPPAPLT